MMEPEERRPFVLFMFSDERGEGLTEEGNGVLVMRLSLETQAETRQSTGSCPRLLPCLDLDFRVSECDTTTPGNLPNMTH